MSAEFWSAPVEVGESGAELLDELTKALGCFVAFPSPAALTAVGLWAAHAHAVDAAESSPRLALLSPEPGSGKTRTLEVLELLVPQPLHALSASPAATFRTIEAERPTLLLDEVDAIFGRQKDDENADLRALLNAGHRRGATIPRCVGPSHDVRRFPVYAAVALAGLGDLPDTLMSRSVIVRMRRRAPHEHVEPFRRRLAEPLLLPLRDRLAAWIESARGELTDAWPELPEGITDRPADVWEPLLAIADAAGGEWPARARTACVELCKVAESREASLGIRLLADLCTVFGDADRMHTDDLLDRLHKLDESPWADLRGKPLDARGLAYRLRQYDVRPVDVKVNGTNRKGYRREDLHDAWSRYLPPGSATSATSATAQVSDPPSVAQPTPVALASATPTPSATDREPVTSGVALVAQVALPAGEGHRRGDQAPEPTLRPEPQAPAVTCAVPAVPLVPLPGGGDAATATEVAELDVAEEVLRRAGMLPGGVAPAPTAYPLRDEAGRPTAWTPAREPVGDCADCGNPTLTYDEDGRPCHPGCALEKVP